MESFTPIKGMSYVLHECVDDLYEEEIEYRRALSAHYTARRKVKKTKTNDDSYRQKYNHAYYMKHRKRLIKKNYANLKKRRIAARTCKDCDKEFKSKIYYRRHMRAVHE